MISVEELAVCLLVPAFTCFLVHRLALLKTRLLAAAWGVSLGSLCGFLALTGYVSWAAARVSDAPQASAIALKDVVTSVANPRVARDWLPSYCLIAIALATFAGRFRGASLWLCGVWFALVPWRLLHKSIYMTSDWSVWGAAVRFLGISIAGAFFCGMMDRNPAGKRGVTVEGDDCGRWSATAVVVFTTAIVLLTSGSVVYGELGLIVGATCGTAAAASAWQRGAWTFAASGEVLITLMIALLVLGYFFAELTGVNALLLTAALGVATADWQRVSVPRRVVVRLFASIAIAAVPVALSVAEFIRAAAANPYSSY